VTSKNTGKYDSIGDKKACVRIKRVKTDRYLTYTANHVKHEIIHRPPPLPTQITSLFYENVTWDGNIKKKLRTIYNYKHCIAVDLILKHNQTDTMLGRIRYMLFIQLA
jgi:hypothetical protein